MAKAKAKVKSHFTHQGKSYQPGEVFEGEEHEINNLAQQGHVEHPQGQQGQGQPGGQTQGQTQGQQPGQDPSQKQKG